MADNLSCLLVLSCVGLLLHTFPTGAQEHDSSPAATEFSQWLAQHRDGSGNVSAADEQIARGLALARARAAEMRALLAVNPEAFVSRAMSGSERDRLPAHMQTLVERRVRGRGFFGVYCGGSGLLENAVANHSHEDHDLGYEVRLDGVSYQAFVYGKWRNQATVREAAIEGVVLDGAIAIGDSPPPDEQAGNGAPVIAETPALNGANTVLYIIAQFSDETNSLITDATALSRMTVVSNFFLNNSSGTVSLRGLVNSNQPMDIVRVVLPQPMSYGATYNNNFSQLLSDARNAASAKGYNYANYNLDVTVTSNQGFGYAGRAWVGGQGLHVISGYTSLRTVGHELGHNFGLYHANYWRTDSPESFGRDSVPGGYVADTSNAERIEYGHYFSVMSAQSGGEMDDAIKPHFAAAEKVRLGWLSGSELQAVAASGTYRLFRHDERSTAGTPRAIRIDRDSSDYTGYARRYWLNYRYAPWTTGVNWLRNGLQIDVCQSSYGGDGAIQLDMTPFSYDDNAGAGYTDDNTDKRDGALVVGTTYSDKVAGIHLTPIATGSNGTNEEYIDIVVNLGTFAANRAPLISSFALSTNRAAANQTVNLAVTATDPDGDALAYAWDFDQVQTWTASGLNSSTTAKSWSSAGQYRVMVTVSDMKGGVATASQIVTVGSPVNTNLITGRVLWAGIPVAGARVWTTAGTTTYQARTESTGCYTLTDLPGTNSFVVNCAGNGLTFIPQFASPVSVAGGIAYGIDFYANQPLAGENGTTFAISGQVTDAGSAVPGAELRCGGMLATTDSSGNYEFTNFIAGNYTITAAKEGWAFSPASRTVTVSSSDSTGNSFSRVAPYSISGTFSGVPAGNQDPAPTVYLSNGRSAVATRQGAGGTKYWGYTLNNVPAGQYSVSAAVRGYILIPSAFANPLNVSGNLTGMNFAGTAGTVAGAISGRVTRGGLPLPGVTVQVSKSGAALGTVTTDSDGCYRVENLTNTSCSVASSLAGYSFSPASLTVNSVPNSGANFTASGFGSAPSIGSATANPSPVSASAMATTLSAVASGSGPLSYSWDATSAAAPLSFSVNDSPAAASTVASFQAPGNYTFRVKVTGTNGLSSTRTASVVVNAGPGSMVLAPYEVQVPSGQTAAFRADAWDQLGNPITVYPQWSVSGGGTISTAGVFTATGPTGSYSVVAVSGALSATGTVWVTGEAVVNPPVITQPPQGQLVAAGSNVTFTVAATGTAPLSYQWQFNGANIAGATRSSYTKASVQSADAGNYTVQVANAAGTVTSAPAALAVNSAPVLAAIPNRTIHAGARVTSTIAATDPDLPAQRLTYALAPGSPTEATIDPASGVFSWASSAKDAGTANQFTVMVADDGSPQLSDARTFTVFVAPALTIASIVQSNGAVVITWEAVPGQTYRVEKKEVFSESWSPALPDVVAGGPTASFTDSNGPDQAFYRVLLVE